MAETTTARMMNAHHWWQVRNREGTTRATEVYLLNVLELLQRCWTTTTAIPSQSPESTQAWDACTSWVLVCYLFLFFLGGGLLSIYWSLDCVYRTTTRMMNGDLRHITCISNPCYVFFFFFSFWYLFYYYSLNLPWCIQPPLPLPSAIATIIGTWDTTMCLKSLVCFFPFFFFFSIFFLIILL